MALTIQGADIGFDANEVQAALNDIHTQVIEQAQNDLRIQLSDLDNAVDEIWVGQSAEIFKKNMQTDVEAICQGLSDAYEVLKSEFSQITSSMTEIDANLVQERSE